jgi:hypothetical protein
MAAIHKQIESARGCGYRKKGGIYLCSDGLGAPCGKLPIPLTVCPCCGAGIKFTRGFTWISSALFDAVNCNNGNCKSFGQGCPLAQRQSNWPLGLLWVGEKYYQTADHFTREADAMGVSKRIATVPHNFEVGKTWIALAHIKASSVINETGNLMFGPGIFRLFRPARIEYIVIGTETPEQLEALEKRGFTLIDVIRDIDTQKEIF